MNHTKCITWICAGAAIAALARPLSAGEEIVVVSRRLTSSASEAIVEIQATTHAGAIQGFVLSIAVDPSRGRIQWLEPAGKWLDSAAPDFVSLWSPTGQFFEEGRAALAVVVDLYTSSTRKSITPTAGGAPQTIAHIKLALAADRVDVQLKDLEGDAPALNSLTIGRDDYIVRSSDRALQLVDGRVERGPQRLRGDANTDGERDITDAIFMLTHLFQAGTEPPCPSTADANADEQIDIADPISLLAFLFQGGATPQPASATCELEEDPAA